MNREILKKAITESYLEGRVSLDSFQKSMKRMAHLIPKKVQVRGKNGKIYQAIRELFQKSIGGEKTVNELAELHGVSIENIVDQLTLGVMVEQEKIGDKNRAKQIALTNLIEFPDYYTKLEAFPKRKDIEIVKSGAGALYIIKDEIKKAVSQFKIDEPLPTIEIKKSTINELSDSVEEFFTSEGIKVYNKSHGLDPLNKSITLRVGDPIKGIHIDIFEKGLDDDNPLHLNIEMDNSEIGKRLLESIGTITLKYPELEKARHGVYQDSPENRRLKRVGQKYGTKRQEDPTKQKQQGKKEESKMSIEEFTDEDLRDFARQASEEELNIASTGKDERLRLAAKIELARRKDEEEIVVVREDELNDDGSIKGDEKEDSEKDIKPKEDERKDKGNRDKE